MEKIDISVIMPALNVENYIAEAIESILSQSGINFELIIINDGSKDSTQKIIDNYIKRYSNIKCIKQNNNGLSHARKEGLNIARGKYICFCDADDILEKNALRFMKEKFELFKLDCLVVNARFKNELNNSFGFKNNGKKIISKLHDNEVKTGEEFLEAMINNYEWRYAVWLYFTTKQKIIDSGISFFKNIIHEDAPYNYQLLNSCKKVKFIDKIIYNYRLRSDSLMSLLPNIRDVKGYVNALYTIFNYNELNFPGDYNKYKFEIRMLDQLIEVYQQLSMLEQKKCSKEINKVSKILEQRNFYNNINYKNLFDEVR
ncbi:MAG: glycosyltransferase [Bacilli bacterium]